MKHLFKHWIWICILLFGTSLQNIYAQVEEPKDTTDDFDIEDNTPALAQAMTLEQCIKHAIENSTKVKRQDIDNQIANVTVKEATSIGLPKLGAYVNYINNLKLQKVIIPDGSLFGGPPGPQPLAFGTQHIGQAYFRLSQLIFSQSYFVGLDAAREVTKLTPLQKKITELEIAETVSKAFFSTLVTEEKLSLVDANIVRIDTILKTTRELYKNGFAENIDVMRLEVNYNNLKTEQKKLKEFINFSKEVLKYQMGMSVNDSLTIEGSLKNIDLTDKSMLTQKPDPAKRPEYQLLTLTETLQGFSLRNQKAQYLPQVTGFFDFGWNTGANQFKDVLKFKKYWFNYQQFGINVQIPIISGFERKHKLNKIMLETKKIELDKIDFERGINFQARKAKTDLVNAIADLEIQEKNMKLAKEVSRVALIKFKNGVGSNLEIINSEADYKTAETNYFDAVYRAIIAKIDLEKALGTLYN